MRRRRKRSQIFLRLRISCQNRRLSVFDPLKTIMVYSKYQTKLIELTDFKIDHDCLPRQRIFGRIFRVKPT